MSNRKDIKRPQTVQKWNGLATFAGKAKEWGACHGSRRFEHCPTSGEVRPSAAQNASRQLHKEKAAETAEPKQQPEAVRPGLDRPGKFQNELKARRLPKAKVRQRLALAAQAGAWRKNIRLWTMTFHRGTSDDKAYRLWNTILTRLRQLVPQFSYLWVAERQKNGTIHFHMLTCSRIELSVIRPYLKKALSDPNFEGFDLAKGRDGKPAQLAGARNFQKVRAYVTKYVTKNQTEMTRQPWGSSHDLANLFTYEALSPRIFDRRYREVVESGIVPHVVEGEWFTLAMYDEAPELGHLRGLNAVNGAAMRLYWQMKAAQT